jgi:hypothetical protein
VVKRVTRERVARERVMKKEDARRRRDEVGPLLHLIARLCSLSTFYFHLVI